MKVFSISIVEGEYEGRTYSNAYVYCEDDRITKYVNKSLRSFKIRVRDLENVMADYKINNAADLIGRRISKLYYDRYGNVNDIRFE